MQMAHHVHLVPGSLGNYAPDLCTLLQRQL